MLQLPPMVTLVAALALAAPAAAQTPGDTTDALTPGRRALAFAIPYGGTIGFGTWHVLAPDRARGFFVNLTALANQNRGYIGGNSRLREVLVSASLGPHVRRYLARSGPVLPFAESALELGASYRSSKQELGADSLSYYGPPTDSHEWSGNALVSTGIGAEWFPLRRMSISGQVGFVLRGSAGKHVDDAGSLTIWSASLGTYNPSLMLQLYF